MENQTPLELIKSSLTKEGRYPIKLEKLIAFRNLVERQRDRMREGKAWLVRIQKHCEKRGHRAEYLRIQDISISLSRDLQDSQRYLEGADYRIDRKED